jgi:hypothetical protein
MKNPECPSDYQDPPFDEPEPLPPYHKSDFDQVSHCIILIRSAEIHHAGRQSKVRSGQLIHFVILMSLFYQVAVTQVGPFTVAMPSGQMVWAIVLSFIIPTSSTSTILR